MKGDRLDNQHALAAIVDALNDVDNAVIDDPREGAYRVAFGTSDMKEAMERAKQLARMIGIIPRTSIEHDSLGFPVRAQVTIYAKADQKRLFECTKTRLSREQRLRFEDLVLARGPIPDDILEKIWISPERGRKPNQIAERMNELGVIAGMGGKRWTAQKVRKALAEYERRRDRHQEAA
jgi:hypothetical protein